MFDPKKEIVSVGNLFVVVSITEKMKSYTGDIDTLVSVQFNNKNCMNIGEYKAVIRGQYIKPIYRDINGNGAELWSKHKNEILEQFQLLV